MSIWGRYTNKPGEVSGPWWPTLASEQTRQAGRSWLSRARLTQQQLLSGVLQRQGLGYPGRLLPVRTPQGVGVGGSCSWQCHCDQCHSTHSKQERTKKWPSTTFFLDLVLLPQIHLCFWRLISAFREDSPRATFPSSRTRQDLQLRTIPWLCRWLSLPAQHSHGYVILAVQEVFHDHTDNANTTVHSYTL